MRPLPDSDVPVNLQTGLMSRDWYDYFFERDTRGASKGASGIFNVKDYGAAGNGSNDDTAAIQKAVDAALIPSLFGSNVYYGRIFFPPGIYKTTAPIVVTPAASGGRSIIFEGCGSASQITGNFNDFIFTNTFLETNGGISGFRDLAVNNGAKTMGSGAIQWPNVLQGAFYHNLDLAGFCGIDMCGPAQGANFSPSVDNCNITGVDVAHLANSCGIRIRSGGGGSITNCIIRGWNNGIRGNTFHLHACDIESNMIGVAAGVDADPAQLGTADGFSTHFLNGSIGIDTCTFEANAVAVWIAGGQMVASNSSIIGDAFCAPLKALYGGLIATGNTTNGSAVITGISPNTTGMYKGQLLKFQDENGDGYIIQSVDSAGQVTLSNNWHNGNGSNTLFCERLSLSALDVRFGNGSVFIRISGGGPFTVAAVNMENPGAEVFINCFFKNDSTPPTWILPFSSNWRFVGNLSSFGNNPPVAGYIGGFSSLPTDQKEGDEHSINDCNTAVFNAVAAGGGSNHVNVRWNGSNWRVSG